MIDNGLSWKDAGLRLLTHTRDEMDFFVLVFREDDASLDDELGQMFFDGYRKSLIGIPGFELSEKLEFQLKSWTGTARKSVRDWVLSGCKDPIEKTLEYITSCIPRDLQEETEKYLMCP